MTNAQMSARVGLFFVLGVALIWVTFESLSPGKFSRNQGYTLVTHFQNLKELKVGDEVRMAGVKIGTVEETRLEGRKAAAVLRIAPAVKVAKDAQATIAMAGLLGANYISLDLGSESAGIHNPGGVLRSLDTADLNTLVSQLGDIGQKIDSALSSFNQSMGGKDGSGLIGKLERLVDENTGKINQVTTDLETITGKINRGEGTLGKLVNDPGLHDEMLATVQEIKVSATQARTFITQTQTLLDQVKSGQGALGVLLYDPVAAQNLQLTLQNARELSDKLNQGKGTLGKLFNDDSLYLQVQGSVRKLDRTLDSMADNAPISALGTVAGSLF